ncbi:MAG: magnesium chelatase subunit H [Rhizobiales bacterium]|nr:magnesium chelatase subunit H [Hyphomicrobiales bacterium]MBO6697265.1 magnesium chelatase subunit H [Hyphomicrobiales bacterium]MBO6736480.1 magnesium chelatase subunit H [Hyphomicrobiales bacterium]MBO6912950.1 magnesium chelatase subunit H [Hyphomicrobiales bacterium]MBO6954118.1 magnesium chelatase subunit H [Hyphomicrobiales bacterium]
MLKLTSAADGTPVKVVIVTLDNHLSGAVERAQKMLLREMPGVSIALHATSEWGDNPDALEACKNDIATGDIILATMLFMDDQIQAIQPALEARRDRCDAMIGMMSAGDVVKLTRVGQFDMSAKQNGAMALLKRLRGSSKKPGEQSSGAKQMAMLKRLPKILRFIPGTAQDVRAYFLTLQYWLSGSDENVANMVRFLVSRYAAGPRENLRTSVKADMPADYPEVGIYHPDLPTRVTETDAGLPTPPKARGTVGLILMRSYLLAGNTAHYDGVIRAIEARGLKVIPVFASGLDARPAAEKFFVKDGRPIVDAMLSLTGFSLVGGPAYNDAKAAEEMLAGLDVPYLAAHAIEFQTLQDWAKSNRGLMPVESTIMVAIPELDGATEPTVFGGRVDPAGDACTGCHKACDFCDPELAKLMQVCSERAERLAVRVDQLITLRRSDREDRRVGIVLFNFPPNGGNTGTAAYLSVFRSLYNVLQGLEDEGYDVEMPESVDALREAIITGNAGQYGTHANVHARIPVDDHVRREPYLKELEAVWGPAPGAQQTDGQSIFVLGAQFGNVFVGVQPAFGYEGDPMRLLFEQGFAPTHAFSAFYRWMREDFGAEAYLHFGTHGALEFMPGKQTGMSGKCWPDRLIGDVPNYYLYASNNPSEGMIAKRRAAATLISYLTPPLAQAGLYKGLNELKASIERWRGMDDVTGSEAQSLATLIQTQAAELDLADETPAWDTNAGAQIIALQEAVLELEYTLIPHGLHIVGEPMSEAERADMIQAIAESAHGLELSQDDALAVVMGEDPAQEIDAETLSALAKTDALLCEDHELKAIIHALDGGFIAPAPGGDVVRTPEVLPTGRNIHGFDPFRIPSAFAMADGAKQADRLLARYKEETGALPTSVALVLWGTDNLKTEGGTIAQGLALMGAAPRFDSYGRLCGAQLTSLEELGRPRVDVVMTLSGIFRDLLPLQTKILAEAALLAAQADEPLDQNPIRAHALAYGEKHGCGMETAALRVFSNADGAYGSNVNNLVESGTWDDEDELAETYERRKSFAYGASGKPVQQAALLQSMLADVDIAYQNLDSVELGVTTIDHYFDTLGGISRAATRAKGDAIPVYIGDQTRGEGKVRSLSEQVALETRTRMLNPKWYEGMLQHGYEGVRQIEEHVTNTMGWSATTGQVQPWVYQQLTETYVLDPEMRRRLADLNPTASARLAGRLLEAHERDYWQPDDAVLDALRDAGEELEDRLEGIGIPANDTTHQQTAAGQSLGMEAAE